MRWPTEINCFIVAQNFHCVYCIRFTRGETTNSNENIIVTARVGSTLTIPAFCVHQLCMCVCKIIINLFSFLVPLFSYFSILRRALEDLRFFAFNYFSGWIENNVIDRTRVRRPSGKYHIIFSRLKCTLVKSGRGFHFTLGKNINILCFLREK